MASSAKQPIGATKRLVIDYWDGVNSASGPELAKHQEPSHAENARSSIIGVLESRNGLKPIGNEIIATSNLMTRHFNAYSGAGKGVFRIATVGGTVRIYSLDAAAAWNPVAALASTSGFFTSSEANGNLIMVNGDVANSYLKSDGVTYVDESSATGHLYLSPKKPYCVNYYKDRIYMGNYMDQTGAVRFQNAVQMSSLPLGVIGLVDGDHLTGVTTVNVTDTKYVRSTDSLEVRRGGILITTLTVSAKTESTLTVAATGAALMSADELWVPNTYAGERIWRWADNASGDPSKTYDAFRVGSDQNDGITAMVNVGDNMVIFTKTSYGVWNNTQLMNGDYGVGCVSRRGWVKVSGAIYFISKNGLFRMNGGAPELVSAPIRRYFWGATKTGLENAVLGVKGESVFAYIGQVTVDNEDGSIEKVIDHCLAEYDLRQENCYVHSLPAALETLDNCPLDENIDVLLGSADDTNHGVYSVFEGETDLRTESPIYFRADTPWLFPNSYRERFSHPLSVSAHVLRGGPIEVFASLDGEPFFKLDSELKKGLSTVWFSKENRDDPMRCRKLKLSFRSFKDRQVRIGWVAMDYVESLELRINNQQSEDSES